MTNLGFTDPDRFDRERIKQNINEIKDKIRGRAEILGATKGVAPEVINYAATCGITIIGENRVNDLRDKYDYLDRELLDIHFIGPLQTNKVKYIIDKVSLIHSVDSLRLAREIDKRAYRIDKRMDVLLEVNVAKEPTKHGVYFEDIDQILEEIRGFENLRVRGLMAIPPKTEDSRQNHAYFNKIQEKFIDLFPKKAHNSNNSKIGILSIGMSDDYLTAVEHGATLVRIGTGIFGSRT